MNNVEMYEKRLLDLFRKNDFLEKLVLSNLELSEKELVEQVHVDLPKMEYPIYRDALDNLKDVDPEGFDRIFNDKAREERFWKAYEELATKLSCEKTKDNKDLKLDISDDWLSSISKGYRTTGPTVPRRKLMNELAINIIDKPIDELTIFDKLILKNYTGKGGIGEEGVEILTQYFTDYQTIDFIWNKLKSMNVPLDNIKALEPSCGIGSFVGFAPESIDWDVIDIDPLLIEMVKRLYPTVNAMNMSFEDLKHDNYYDLVITNVPFSNSRGLGLVKDKPNIRKLHDYFILATVDKLKPNGVGALIVPSSFMDGVNTNIREMLVKEVEIISCYRLPDKVFAKTGADVITDVIFFRKRIPNSKDSVKTFDTNNDFLAIDFPEEFQKLSRQLPLNRYYVTNPDKVLGYMEEYKNRYGQHVIKVKGSLNKTILDRALSITDRYVPGEGEVVTENNNLSVEKILSDLKLSDTTPLDGLFRVKKDVSDNLDSSETGAMSMEQLIDNMDQNNWYRKEVKKEEGVIKEKAVPVFVPIDLEPAIEAILEVSSIALSMRIYARKGDKDTVAKMIGRLEEEVNLFKKEYTYIFENKRLKKIMEKDPRYAIVKVLCNDPDIFKKDTITNKYSIPLNNSHDIDEVFQYLMLRDKNINIKNFAEVYKDGELSVEEAEKFLNKSKEVFKTPSVEEVQVYKEGVCIIETRRVKSSYERAIDYLSGDIYKKIKYVQYELEQGNLEYQKNLDELLKVIPKPRTINDVNLSVKHRWIDSYVVETFIRQELGYVGFNMVYDEIKGNYQVNFTDYYCRNHDMNKKLNIGRPFPSWIENYLNRKEIIIRDSDGKKNIVASARITEKMKIVDVLFMAYLKQNPEIADELIKQYNHLFNNTKLKDYKNDHMIIPEVGEGWTFRDNQLEAANQAISLGVYCNSHRVGAGKTATSALINHMLKVLGRAKKPIQVVPGKVIKKFIRDIKYGSRGLAPIFPNMKILDTTEYSFNEALAMIAYNEWDLVLMPDTWFKEIAMTPQREMAYIKKQINDMLISENLRAMERGTRRQQKEFEKRLSAYKARLAELRNYIRKDGLYFEDLGIDAISLDEAQSVKNLVASVRGSELGLSATPSQIALDFNMKCQYILEITNGNNIFLSTATPVSNSILEIYALLLNLAPYEWESRYIFTADDFIDFFADTSVTYGITKENEVGVVRKVDGFINLDDLRSLFSKYVDYRPFIDNIELPEVKELRITERMTLGQRTFFNSLLERLKNIPADKSIDNVLKILVEGRQASISESLFSGVKPTRKNSPKIAKAIDIMLKLYKETGGNQLIFLDQYGRRQLGSDDLHNFIRNELIKEGIPANEIVICNGNINNTMEKKLEIQDDFNDGKYRFLIGTTSSIGAGMDLQEQTIAMHNLDIPWTPTAVSQKEGRGNRPGNLYNGILNLHYYIRGSYDAWSASIVAIKKKWQDQLLLGGTKSVGGYTKNQDDDSWSMDTIMAEIMEDPDEKAKLNFNVKIKSLQKEKQSLEEMIKQDEKAIEDIMTAIKDRKEKIKEYEKDKSIGKRVKLANMRITQLSESITKLMEEANRLSINKENYERELKEKINELNNYEQSYETILEDIKKQSNIKNLEVNIEEVIIELKEINKDVILPQITDNSVVNFFDIFSGKVEDDAKSQERVIFKQFYVEKNTSSKINSHKNIKKIGQLFFDLDNFM